MPLFLRESAKMFAMCKCRKPRKDEILPTTTDLADVGENLPDADGSADLELDGDDDKGDYYVEDEETDHTADLEPGESFTALSSPGTTGRLTDSPRSIADEHEFIDVDEALGSGMPGAEILDASGMCMSVRPRPPPANTDRHSIFLKTPPPDHCRAA